MDVYSLLSIVKSYYQVDNYDLHVKLCIASKKYHEFTKDSNIDKYFDVEIDVQPQLTEYKVCGILHKLHGPARINYYDDGSIKSEQYYINGNLHREIKPAFIEYYENGSIKSGRHYIYNKLHREDELIETVYCSQPAWIEYYENGSLKSGRYYINGKLHCDNGPTWVDYYEDGLISREIYYVVCNLHYIDKIAWIDNCSDVSSGLKLVSYSIHRVDGPAYIEYYKNGSIKQERYHIDNELYRADKVIDMFRYPQPVWIEYYENGSIKQEKYYVDFYSDCDDE